MTVGVDSLIPPHEVSLGDVSRMALTRRGMPRGQLVDPGVLPRVFRAKWMDVSRLTAQAIEDHFLEHEFAVISLFAPSIGVTVFCKWSAAPVITWKNSAWASLVSAELIETYSR